MSQFENLALFIQEHIYKHRWETLHDVQVAACDIIFNTKENLLLATPTASGKTEAAFLPAITEIYNNPSKSVGILYIAPLRALINDQFVRIEELLEESDITVTKWHGESSRAGKDKLLKKPKGIMQTTPESLEAMVMKRKTEAVKLFSDLKFIIVDEVHNFLSDDRGIQLISVLENLQKIAQCNPRRIGLSATIGDTKLAEIWLNMGTNRNCITPKFNIERKKAKLQLKHFGAEEPFYESLYNLSKGKKTIIFSNSRADVDMNINRLKLLAKEKSEPDVFFVHHGSISKELREFAENQMKNSETPLITGATVTLELGIDLGDLDRIIQTGSPTSVSSLAQRLGRSGRRGAAAEMCFVFNEEPTEEKTIFYKKVNWYFIKCIALIELFRENWIEPKEMQKYPYNILVHQTLSFLYSYGEASAGVVAKNLLTREIFKNIELEDYKELLQFLLAKELIEKTEDGKILIGEKGEYVANNFEFYTVFENPKEYTVRDNAQVIGTLYNPLPVGERFALAGRTWQVTELDTDKNDIYVKFVGGKSTVSWSSPTEDIQHTKVLQKMREIIYSTQEYGYLDEKSKERLSQIRDIMTLANCEGVFKISPTTVGIFPWLGTKATNKLWFSSIYKGLNVDLAESNWVVTVINNTTGYETARILDMLKNEENPTLALPKELRPIGKYGEFVPEGLRKKQFIDKYT